MKIAFFTEGQYKGKVPRTHNNMRTDLAWMCALDADHHNIHSPSTSDTYDLGIIIIPKNNPEFNIDNIKACCKKLASMQEGPHWYFQEYPIGQQIWYYTTLLQMDYILVHNKLDANYYSGITGKDCIILPSLMIEDTIKDIPKNTGTGVMIGGNFCNWYGGFDSYIVAQEFEQDIFVPSMGRKIQGEEQMDNLNHLPYMNWTNWIAELSKRKYAVHLMRTHAAGTFALNCAYLGIPCIGYEGLDTQMNCHPDCTVKIGDIYNARKIANRLKTDAKFYEYCSKLSMKKYKEVYSEDKFNSTWTKQLKIS